MKGLISVSIVLMALTQSIQCKAQFNDNVVIAHRGAWKMAGLPENSLASLRHAIKLGCHGSEFDVHLTKDDVLVVNHDKDFYGMDIENSTYKQLLSINHSNGEKIPTVEEYLSEGMKQQSTKLILEIKASGSGKERTLRLTKMAVDLVGKMGAGKWVEYISFDYDAGKLVHTLDPKTRVAYLNGDKTPAQARRDGYTGLDYKYTVYKNNPAWIKQARELGLTVNAWTVNTREEMEDLLNQKADYITTNEPELLLEILKNKKPD